MRLQECFEDFFRDGSTYWAPSSYQYYKRNVDYFFNYLYRRKYTGIRYTEGLKLPRSDDDQIVSLLASEVYRIDWIFDEEKPGDLVFDSNTIVINRSKGNKSRVLLMCPLLEKLLRQYMQVFHPKGTLFRKLEENKGINGSVVKALFQRIVRNTGIERLHPHLLRHTFATSYIMGGGNLETLRLLLGHFDYSVTRKYLHLAAQYQITGTDIYRLDPIFFKKGY